MEEIGISDWDSKQRVHWSPERNLSTQSILNARVNTFIQRWRQQAFASILYGIWSGFPLLFWGFSKCDWWQGGDCAVHLHILSQHSYLCLGSKRSGSMYSLPNEVKVYVFQLQGKCLYPKVHIKLQSDSCDSSCLACAIMQKEIPTQGEKK